MRCLGPEPSTNAKLTPSSRANFLTDGVACDFLLGATATESPIGAGVCCGLIFCGGSGAGREGSGMIALGASSFLVSFIYSFTSDFFSDAVTSSIKIGEPCLILSPTFKRISLTVPA